MMDLQSIPIEALMAEIIRRCGISTPSPNSARERLIHEYGEVCTQACAARILGISNSTVRDMVEDGRLQYACNGNRVLVESIADYIERKPEIDAETRARKAAKKRAENGETRRWYIS